LDEICYRRSPAQSGEKRIKYCVPGTPKLTGTNGGTYLAGGSTGTSTMAMGFQNLSDYTSIRFARIVLNAASVAQFTFTISDGNKVKGSFDFAIPGQ
jgi:hypothetical protein